MKFLKWQLDGTCYWQPRINGEKYKLKNIRIDTNDFGMMEGTTYQFTSATQFILYYYIGSSSGLPKGKRFNVGDTIISDDPYIGERVIKRVKLCVGLYNEMHHYEIEIN